MAHIVWSNRQTGTALKKNEIKACVVFMGLRLVDEDVRAKVSIWRKTDIGCELVIGRQSAAVLV